MNRLWQSFSYCIYSVEWFLKKKQFSDVVALQKLKMAWPFYNHIVMSYLIFSPVEMLTQHQVDYCTDFKILFTQTHLLLLNERWAFVITTVSISQLSIKFYNNFTISGEITSILPFTNETTPEQVMKSILMLRMPNAFLMTIILCNEQSIWYVWRWQKKPSTEMFLRRLRVALKKKILNC